MAQKMVCRVFLFLPLKVLFFYWMNWFLFLRVVQLHDKNHPQVWSNEYLKVEILFHWKINKSELVIPVIQLQNLLMIWIGKYLLISFIFSQPLFVSSLPTMQLKLESTYLWKEFNKVWKLNFWWSNHYFI